jgi:hypothetical protein
MRNRQPQAWTVWKALCRVCVTLAVLAGATGCPEKGKRAPIPYPPLRIEEAIGLVNRNNARVTGALKAKAGHARGHYTDSEGKRKEFDVDAALLVLPPRHLRLDMSVLGNSQFIFGSNGKRYWMEQPPADALTWGRHEQADRLLADDLIIRPDLMIEALGFNPLPENTTGDGGPVQRITPDYQQLLFLDYDSSLQGFITKEYWLSRHDPQLIARIIFRDSLGLVTMDSKLSAYRRMGEGGPLLPSRVEVNWPESGSAMVFTTMGWSQPAGVTESHPGFAFPLDRGEHFTRIIDIDAKLDNIRGEP